jgi:uncharacterized protein (DUF433 family)
MGDIIAFMDVPWPMWKIKTFLREIEKGVSPKKLASKYGLSVEKVKRIINCYETMLRNQKEWYQTHIHL